MIITKNLTQLAAAAVVLAASALAPSAAMAHGGADPMHGGVVQIAADLSFELVPTPDGAVIYIQDHGKDADASRFDGKLTVLNGAEKSEAPLKAAGGNKLEAKGVQLAKGAKAVAMVSHSGKKSITVRFAIK